jgi:hypothetical protein
MVEKEQRPPPSFHSICICSWIRYILHVEQDMSMGTTTIYIGKWHTCYHFSQFFNHAKLVNHGVFIWQGCDWKRWYDIIHGYRQRRQCSDFFAVVIADTHTFTQRVIWFTLFSMSVYELWFHSAWGVLCCIWLICSLNLAKTVCCFHWYFDCVYHLTIWPRTVSFEVRTSFIGA